MDFKGSKYFKQDEMRHTYPEEREKILHLNNNNKTLLYVEILKCGTKILSKGEIQELDDKGSSKLGMLELYLLGNKEISNDLKPGK